VCNYVHVYVCVWNVCDLVWEPVCAYVRAIFDVCVYASVNLIKCACVSQAISDLLVGMCDTRPVMRALNSCVTPMRVAVTGSTRATCVEW
jgi:hypothetical protein